MNPADLIQESQVMQSESKPKPPPPRRLSDALPAALQRIERRFTKRESPIRLPWGELNEHFGGGFWPGLHFINKGTGIGGTQFVLQAGLHTARNEIPTLYIGLEMGELDTAVRVLGAASDVPWSHLWTGRATEQQIERAREACRHFPVIPFYYEVAKPHGYTATDILAAAESLREMYPEGPILVVVDFLQLIGGSGDMSEARARVGQAAYSLRELATRDFAVLCISSIARERYKLQSEIQKVGGLAWETNQFGCPTERRVLDTDALVGAGKESGEIEYSADSVSIIARVRETISGNGCDVVFATAKGRATGATWSPLHFTGFAYQSCSDHGAGVVAAWKADDEARDSKREEKQNAKDKAKVDRIRKDADALMGFVGDNPGCTVREARVHAVDDNPRRWSAAVALLGKRLVRTEVKTKGGKAVGLTVALEGE